MEPTTTKITSTQLFLVLYITLTGLVDSIVPNSGPWSLLGPLILWWALPTGLAAPCSESPNASTYAWLPESSAHQKIGANLIIQDKNQPIKNHGSELEIMESTSPV
ncbi:hypothetical protein DSO57_1007264 [Entomophthora muscae]|uniref:Uncharacterized protein n=1 Tax=Entomophthora muscae TaxID=34485 RepID=A0ACC2UGW7_9FUNG|nr:hypothetical protein DSO57_1007264 [Entomophthora muscae]